MAFPPDLQQKRWNIRPTVSAEQRVAFGHIHPILLQILFNRGLTTAPQIQSFLERRYLAADDPFLLADMQPAVARIQQALERDESIVVYGDFDADGVTATVLLTEALRGLGMPRHKVRPYIPDRVDEGYGLNTDALTKIRTTLAADLVITVDCGIRSVVEVAHANAIGLDMIITDHHSIGAALPPAVAVINPQRRDSAYPERRLAGVGVAYKLAQALHSALPQYSAYDLTRLLDLVAIGTVADLMPLQGENRRLVTEGLSQLNLLRRPGLLALADVAGLKSGQITAESISFGIAPRINAAGRLAHAYDAAKVLAALDVYSARELAQELEALNRHRQRLTEEQGQHAETLIDSTAPILIAADSNFGSGIVGLVAGRLAEKYYRPTIVIEQGEEESRGSCRSIPEFHITHALDAIAPLLVRYGGHAAAAGFTVRTDCLPEFRDAIGQLAAAELAGQTLIPALEIDAEISLRDIDFALFESLSQLEPTGMDNQPPLFMSRNVQVLNYRVVGRDATHLQFEVAGDGAGFKAIAFRMGSWAAQMPRRVDIVYTIGINEWNGRRTLQLVVRDLRSADESDHAIPTA